MKALNIYLLVLFGLILLLAGLNAKADESKRVVQISFDSRLPKSIVEINDFEPIVITIDHKSLDLNNSYEDETNENN